MTCVVCISKMIRSCQRMARPMAAFLRHLRGLRGMRMSTRRIKIMVLFLVGAVLLMAPSSSAGTPKDFLPIFSHSLPPTETPLPTGPIDVCFISSVYAKSAAMADAPGNFEELNKNVAANTFAFFLYTNLEDLDTPGWHKIIKRDLNYRRYITQSRWGKFMGWKDPQLQGCKTIFYCDGYFEPSNINPAVYLEMAHTIRQSDVGLAQVRHPYPERTPLEEFQVVLRNHKDIPENVEASIKWLQAQPDFFNNCTLYANWYFGYDPTNENFKKATEYFWDHYSMEEDSWRDQPLWCYTLEHFHLKPLRMRELFYANNKRMGHKGHRYDASQDNDAAAAVVAKNPT